MGESLIYDCINQKNKGIFFVQQHKEDSLMKTRKKIFYIVCMAAGVLSLLIAWKYVRQQVLQRAIAGKILRFHVLAASDSEADQELKLKVRDAVGSYMEVQLAGADSRQKCEEIVSDYMDEIISVAKETVVQEGYDYDVTASLAEVDFPVKKYGSYTFPAGKYEALEVVIGQGEGHNWWCVMYPNMCFSGSVYEIVEEDADEALRQVLTREEYKEVFSSGKVKVRCKYISFINNLLGEQEE
jgi:stage II sporulation protein R